MKNILTICFVLLASTVFSRQHSSPENAHPAEDSSFIYIYRGGQFAGAFTNFAIWVDETKLCKISNNKFLRVPVSPGTHVVSAKQGGVAIMKKETEVEIDVEAGKSYYVSCNMKSSITRVRLEMIEVVEKTGKRAIESMKPDNCQGKIDE